MGLKKNDGASARHVQWVINTMQNVSNESCDDLSEESFGTMSSANSSDETYSSSSTSSCIEDDASSSNSCGPLYELSDLMVHLPIKRGLSKYYQGKSQSFGCLGSVSSLEDLAKKGNTITYSKRMKSSKSFGGGLDERKSLFGPKATITKKSMSKRHNLSLVNETTTLVANCRSPISFK